MRACAYIYFLNCVMLHKRQVVFTSSNGCAVSINVQDFILQWRMSQEWVKTWQKQKKKTPRNSLSVRVLEDFHALTKHIISWSVLSYFETTGTNNANRLKCCIFFFLLRCLLEILVELETLQNGLRGFCVSTPSFFLFYFFFLKVLLLKTFEILISSPSPVASLYISSWTDSRSWKD